MQSTDAERNQLPAIPPPCIEIDSRHRVERAIPFIPVVEVEWCNGRRAATASITTL
jgi:hypothetical protein